MKNTFDIYDEKSLIEKELLKKQKNNKLFLMDEFLIFYIKNYKNNYLFSNFKIIDFQSFFYIILNFAISRPNYVDLIYLNKIKIKKLIDELSFQISFIEFDNNDFLKEKITDFCKYFSVKNSDNIKDDELFKKCEKLICDSIIYKKQKMLIYEKIFISLNLN